MDAFHDYGVTDSKERESVYACGGKERYLEFIYTISVRLSSQSTVFHKVPTCAAMGLGRAFLSRALADTIFPFAAATYTQAPRPAYPHATHTCPSWQCIHSLHLPRVFKLAPWLA
jgi:hypothetical protein